jgi:drug/metabolite transporter (DMT)-like permease
VVPLGVLAGLGAAGCWGVGVFCSGLASRRASVLTTIIVGDLTGTLVALVLALLTSEGFPGPAGLAWAAFAGLFGLGGTVAFLSAIRVNPIGLITPVATLLSVAVPVLFDLASGERLSATEAAGMAAAVVAVVLVSLPAGAASLDRRTLALALVTGVTWGGFYIAMDMAAASGTQTWWPIAVYRGTATVAVVAVAIAVSRVRLVRREASPLMVGAGGIDVVGTALYMLSSARSSLGLAAVTSAMYPAIAALLARFFLKERLARVHVVGIAVAIAGIVLMAVP